MSQIDQINMLKNRSYNRILSERKGVVGHQANQKIKNTEESQIYDVKILQKGQSKRLCEQFIQKKQQCLSKKQIGNKLRNQQSSQYIRNLYKKYLGKENKENVPTSSLTERKPRTDVKILQKRDIFMENNLKRNLFGQNFEPKVRQKLDTQGTETCDLSKYEKKKPIKKFMYQQEKNEYTLKRSYSAPKHTVKNKQITESKQLKSSRKSVSNMASQQFENRKSTKKQSNFSQNNTNDSKKQLKPKKINKTKTQKQPNITQQRKHKVSLSRELYQSVKKNQQNQKFY